jgi:hypothetical protein
MLPVIVAVLLLFVILYFVARNEVVKRRVTCPRTGTTAEIDQIQRFEGEKRPVGVKRCDLLPDPDEVDCDEDCLK